MLSQRARVVLDTLLPARAHPALKYGVFDASFETFWSEFDRAALPAWRWGFRAALFVATWIAPLLIRRLPPLTLYDRRTRERALAAMTQLNLSARAYHRTRSVKLARTIADLAECEEIQSVQLAEALHLR